MKIKFLLLVLGIFAVSCSTTKSSTYIPKAKEDKSIKLKESEVQKEFALESYLRRTPGVIISGSGDSATVRVRGINSINSGTEPLFVINGTPAGHSYNQAIDIVRGMKIKSVRVLKDADAAIYGVRGANGVVVIKTAN